MRTRAGVRDSGCKFGSSPGAKPRIAAIQSEEWVADLITTVQTSIHHFRKADICALQLVFHVVKCMKTLTPV